MPEHEELLTVDEVGTIGRWKRNTTYELINSGQLVSVKIGNLRRIPRSELDAFIARCIEKAKASNA